jgi:hypothetical protein
MAMLIVDDSIDLRDCVRSASAIWRESVIEGRNENPILFLSMRLAAVCGGQMFLNETIRRIPPCRGNGLDSLFVRYNG